MKVMKSIGKWILCVFISYAVVLAIVVSYYGIVGAVIKSKADTLLDFNNEDTREMIIMYDNQIKEGLKTSEEMTDEEIDKSEFLSEYSTGYEAYVMIISYQIRVLNICTPAILIGLMLGTAIFLLSSKNTRMLKVFIVAYLITIIIFGFVEGILSIVGEATILDYWTFPDNYIGVITFVFAIALVAIYAEQKRIAHKLNDKLKDIKK